ncbi:MULTISPECIES: hypothetical protein [Flavobacteriaceae]|uniref:Secreted protein n=2 Tax=Flavobacteriaceae TaxID=49546 RepID=A0A4Y8AZE1_9FLAO|nr:MULTISPECIES: hypothetical protein [Flavobacteriaceae]TEW77138.1 hypothetical protein E2488_04630 [Gramella jeungdoensis]GGK57512.1 hypothetical protein GCM10007963_27190 [Lutibacter litoralis]
MKISLKIFFNLLLIGSLSNAVFSQTDTTKIKKIDTEINTTQSTNQLKAVSKKNLINPSTQLDLNINKQLNTAAINKKLNETKPNSNSNFLLETLPEDSDIIGKKYWNNKDVTHTKLKSNYSLGTVKSTTKTVKVECRDYSYVDGDRIRIFVNEQVVSDNIGLKGNYYVYYITLEKGYNRIDFQAINQGLSGPNTAELNLYDANGNLISSKEWALGTGQNATLGVLHY